MDFYKTEHIGFEKAAADKELGHVSSLLFSDMPMLLQLTAFSMMSYVEKLSPGAVYRKTGPPRGAHRPTKESPPRETRLVTNSVR